MTVLGTRSGSQILRSFLPQQTADLHRGIYRVVETIPVAHPGRYRLVVEPPAGYAAPSQRTAADMAALRQPDGTPFDIVAGSFGNAFAVTGPEPVEIAIPLDKIGKPIELDKKADRSEAAPGDTIVYSIGLRVARVP